MVLSRASIVEQKTATMVRKFLFIFVNLKLLILRLKIVSFPEFYNGDSPVQLAVLKNN